MTPLPHSQTQAPQEQQSDLGEGHASFPALPRSAEANDPQRRRGLTGILMILVLALAFLAASFPARNSDLWFHLATGRLLAQGRFSFGVDPFAYTTQHVYWTCHTWLFDLVLYGLRSLIGDAGLVVCKALVVATLAGLLLRLRRPEGAAWLPVVCTTLAILAISPRLLLQPACLSYFLLGLTFWLLLQQKESRKGLAFLLLIFLLWVNVDEWFWFGPLLVALFWLGERLQGQRRTPGWLAPAGLTVCLLNPYTYHAFTLPAELSTTSWTSGLRDDVRFQGQFASPWDMEHLHAALRLNAAVLAYYALTLLGLASFLLHPPARRDGRLLIWLPFALLAAWQARLLPFFAVIAAPITALNGQDILLRRRKAKGERMQTDRLASSFLVLILLALLALTWLGWLSGYDREERRVAWKVQEEPSLRQATETLTQWRRQGLLLPNERIFALAPEVAHYSAWFCPGEKHFFDHRYPLFSQTARDYEMICRALLPFPIAPEEGRTTDWEQVLHEYNVGIVVFYDRDPQHLFAVLHHLGNDPENWTLLHIAGQVLIAGWNKARPSGGFASLAFDPERWAFGPQDAQTQRIAPPAPEQGPQQLPSRRDFWARLVHPPLAPTWESAAATMYLFSFEDSEAAQRQQKWQILLPSYAASLVGLATPPSAGIQVGSQLLSSKRVLFPDEILPNEPGPFFAPLMERSPALLLLAIRAARRAVVANPEDANAWLRLGQAYLLLRELTCEHSNSGWLPPLTQLRQVQIVATLEEAVRLDPNLENAHHELAYLYGAANALDQALEHRMEELRLSRRAGPLPSETSEEFAYRLENLDKDAAKLEVLVQDRRKQFASGANAFQGDRLAQARLALKLGLARKAAEEILLPTPADVLGAAGIRLELELLLSLGKTQEVRTILSDKGLRASKHGLGYADHFPWPAYEWLHVLTAAAFGDYAQAREDLRALRAAQRAECDRLQQGMHALQTSGRELLPSLLSGPLPFLPAFTALVLGHAFEEKKILETRLRTFQAQQADLCVLEGLLALEQGDTGTARSVFAEAQKLGAEVPFAARPILVAYLDKLKE
jgi:tetratricopeptide (TPR) repeat protein